MSRSTGGGSRSGTVRERMTEKVVVVEPTDTLATALARLRLAHVTGCPVVDPEGGVVGMLTERDIAHGLGTHRLSSRPFEALDLVLPGSPWGRPEVLRGLQEALHRLTVEDAMSSPAETIEADASVGEAVHRMKLHRVNRLPVVEAGRLAGILTRGDLLFPAPTTPASKPPPVATAATPPGS